MIRLSVPQHNGPLILPISASGLRTAKLIKGARLSVVKDGPHCITWTHADEVNAELVNFEGPGGSVHRMAASARRTIYGTQVHHPADAGSSTETMTSVPTINSFTLSQHIPHAQLIIYPDSGHASQSQYPDLFLSHARTFLEG